MTASAFDGASELRFLVITFPALENSLSLGTEVSHSQHGFMQWRVICRRNLRLCFLRLSHRCSSVIWSSSVVHALSLTRRRVRVVHEATCTIIHSWPPPLNATLLRLEFHSAIYITVCVWHDGVGLVMKRLQSCYRLFHFYVMTSANCWPTCLTHAASEACCLLSATVLFRSQEVVSGTVCHTTSHQPWLSLFSESASKHFCSQSSFTA